MNQGKFDVYKYDADGIVTLFSKGIKREFGQNKVVFTDGHQIFGVVMPLHDSEGLELIGHLTT